VRLALKRPFSDTTAIDLDPLSLLWRLAASVPAPRAHTVKYAGVLAAARKLRPKIVPRPVAANDATETEHGPQDEPLLQSLGGARYRPWAELLKRTFEVDVLCCDNCGGRMRLMALVTEATSVARFLRALGRLRGGC
jgi:hypothetical protein